MNNFKNNLKILYLRLIQLFRLKDNFVNYFRKKAKTVYHNKHIFKFSVPNRLCMQRALSFASKEPETLEWIDNFPMNVTLWDIGANVGLYSVYAAKTRDAKVYSFEPSVFNLEVLARNIHLNNLNSNITIIPIALNDITGRGELNMTTEDIGGALSTFDRSYGFDGKEIEVSFSYALFSISMDDAFNKLGIPAPDYLKIDVDGIEHLILQGGREILGKVKGVLIELPGIWEHQTHESEKFLNAAGLTKVFNNNWHPLTNPKGSPNQIWVRK
jgi:FkbM family methyltransferase